MEATGDNTHTKYSLFKNLWKKNDLLKFILGTKGDLEIKFREHLLIFITY